MYQRKEQAMDAIFQEFVAQLESTYLNQGPSHVKTELSHFLDSDLEEVVSSICNDTQYIIEHSDIEESFNDAVNYMEQVYGVRSYQAAEGDLI